MQEKLQDGRHARKVESGSPRFTRTYTKLCGGGSPVNARFAIRSGLGYNAVMTFELAFYSARGGRDDDESLNATEEIV